MRLARAAAVLGGGVPLRPAAGLAEVDADDAAQAVDALVAAGILRPPLPHELLHALEFVHPLVRTAVYAGLGPAGRSRDHARAARLLDLEAGSPELVAAQLLRCQPAGDPWAYERLVAAARLASARGAADAATLYLRRALDEPPPPRSRPGALLDLATAEFRNSEPGVSIGHLREAMAGELDSGQRFRATMLLAGLLGQTGQVADAVELLEQHVDALADRPDLRATAEAGLVNITRIDPAARPRAGRVIERLRRRVDAGQEHDQAVLGTIAAEMGMAGEPAGPMADLAERSLDGFDLTIGSAAGWSGYNAVRSLDRGRALRRPRCRSWTARSRWLVSAGRCSTSAPRSCSAPSCTCRPATSRPPRSTPGASARSRTCAGGRWARASRWRGSARS